MFITRVRAAAIGAAVSVLGIFAANSAHAAVYAGSWDPSYGGIFADLGWRAQATFDVPQACLGQADATYTATGNCSGFSVLSATLEFYNIAAPSNTLETFNLNTSVIINGLDIAHGDLVGINTGFFNAVVPSGASKSIAGNGNYAFSLFLYNSTFAQLAYTRPTTISPPGCQLVPGSECGLSSNASEGVITPAVPEPETYALMLAGLGGIGWFTRRRQQQNAAG